MAWIEAHQELSNHRKIIRLKNLLKIPKTEAIGTVMMLWWWSVDNAPSGDLSNITAEELAEIVDYRGRKPQLVMEALIESGFIDNDMQIHDWHEYTGRLLEQRKIQKQQNKERAKKWRTRQKQNKSDNNASVTRDEGVDNNAYVTENNAPTVQHTTEHNSTVQNISDGDHVGGAENFENPSMLADGLSGCIMTANDKEEFCNWTASLFSDKFGRSATKHDVSNMFDLISNRIMSDGKMTLDDDTKELVELSFDAALNMNNTNWSYIQGIWRNFNTRGIKTVDDYWDYEYNRDKAKK